MSQPNPEGWLKTALLAALAGISIVLLALNYAIATDVKRDLQTQIAADAEEIREHREFSRCAFAGIIQALHDLASQTDSIDPTVLEPIPSTKGLDCPTVLSRELVDERG